MNLKLKTKMKFLSLYGQNVVVDWLCFGFSFQAQMQLRSTFVSSRYIVRNSKTKNSTLSTDFYFTIYTSVFAFVKGKFVAVSAKDDFSNTSPLRGRFA